MSRVRVLIVDDSALVRQLLSAMLGADAGIEVVGTAADPLIAREKIKQLNPDVLTLDVEMPRMDGLSFLENLMRLRPMPVVMVSSLTARGAEVTMRALELGAVDFVTKPANDVSGLFGHYADEIVAKVKAAARARVRPHRPALAIEPRRDADAVLARTTRAASPFGSGRLIAIGSSAGGTEAVRDVLASMPPDAPPIAITQHIPAQFSRAFAARLDACSAMRVCEAADGQPIQTGHAYVAPGDRHLLVVRDGARYACKLSDGPLVSRHRPSADVLFRSVAQAAGVNAVGVILTGMGDDGARGLLEMREAGASTLAQDEATSVVWGMPGAAWKLGAAAELVALDAVAARVLELASVAPSRERARAG